VAKIRSPRWWGGLTSLLVIAFVGGVALLMGWNLGGLGRADASGEPSPSASETQPAQTGSAISGPDDAIPLTAAILDNVKPGWFLTTYNSSSGRYLTTEERAAEASATPGASSSDSDSPYWDTEGTRRIFLVDRVGTVYAGADLGVSSNLEIRLWLPGGRIVIVARPEEPGSNRVVLYAFDVITGELSAPFDGPGAAAPFGSNVVAPSASPGATPAPTATPTPVATADPAAASPVWIGGEVRLAASGDAILVTDGEETRQWVLLSLEGRAIAQVIPPVVAMSFVEDPTGDSYVAGERVETTSQRWIEADLVWVDQVDVYWNTVSYLATPTGDAEVDRVDHGAPPEEVRCGPLSWAPDRQLLDACARADGTTVLYTVAPRTDTFAKAAVFPTTTRDPYFLVKPDATRVAVGRTVYSVVGDVAWELASSEATPAGLAWSGDLLVLWGDRAATLAPGYGASEVRAHDAFNGEAIYTLVSRPGEAGFGPLVPAS
jgi:hypothetical protein